MAEVQSPSATVRGYQRYNVRLKNTSFRRKLCNVDRLCLTHMFHNFPKKIENDVLIITNITTLKHLVDP